MEWLYIACILVAAIAMVVITIIIPYGVFMRYAMDSASSWPEPAGILMMIVFSFIGGAAAYRANAHITVGTLRSLREHEETFTGESFCHGSTRNASCSRVLRWVGTVNYKTS